MAGIFRTAVLSLGLATCAVAQKHELALTAGSVLSQDRGAATNAINLGSGIALQVNYAHQIVKGNRYASLYGDVQFMANPQRVVASTVTTAIRDLASLYVVPGVKVKFVPEGKVSPWFSIGAGYSLYEHSANLLNGLVSPVPRHLNRGTIGYGGGLDWKAWRNVSLRLEARDFYSGGVAYNVTGTGGGQHNQVAGGGIVLRFK